MARGNFSSAIWGTSFWNFYRPPTKLREGNVFSRVCPSFCRCLEEKNVNEWQGYGVQR